MTATLTLVLLLSPLTLRAQDDDRFDKAVQALEAREYKQAVKLLDEVIQKDPKKALAYYYRGVARDQLDDYAGAVADLTMSVTLEPKAAQAWNARGAAHFKLGKIKESIADFDAFLELRPKEKAGHWMRGISLYYAGRFVDGYKQFEAYEKVDTNDVENAVWHYLCLAKHAGPDQARKQLLKIGNDTRVPMMQVYELFAAKLKPDDILAACKALEKSPETHKRALFYAHLYLGLYHDVRGNTKQALIHLNQATEVYRIDHYMWHVARVHRNRLK